MTHALLALALLAQDPFAVDTLRPAGGPEVLWHRDASPIVALRLAAPVDADLPTGTAELLQELARPAAEAEARRFGARLELRVEGDEAVITLTGPAAAFDALVGILRDAVAEPALPVAALRAARARAEDRVLASLERPVPRLRSLVRAALLGVRPTGPVLERLGPERIRALAGRVYEPRRLRIVLVGDLPPEIVRSAFAAWPRHATFETAAAPDSAAPLPRPQAHHAWAALAYPLDVDLATGLVAAALVRDRIRTAGLRQGAAEAWTLRGRTILVVLGGAARDDPEVTGAARITAFPTAGSDEDDVSALARFLRRMVAEAATLAGPAAVADAATVLRRDLLVAARTSSGRAETIGQWAGSASPSPSVHDVLAGLEGVAFEDVRTALIRALETPAVRAEVRP